MDFLDRPWRSFSFSSNDYGRGGVCHSRADGHLFDGAWLQYQEQHRCRRCARQKGRHPARQSATWLFPDRRITVRDESAAHLLIGIDAAATVRTVSNMPLHVRGFVLRKLAIHPRNQSS
jgi:hypothetical protein